MDMVVHTLFIHTFDMKGLAGEVLKHKYIFTIYKPLAVMLTIPSFHDKYTSFIQYSTHPETEHCAHYKVSNATEIVIGLHSGISR